MKKVRFEFSVACCSVWLEVSVREDLDNPAMQSLGQHIAAALNGSYICFMEVVG